MGHGLMVLTIWFALLCGPMSFSDYSPLMESARFEQDIRSGRLKKLADKTDVALNTLIRVAIGELKKRNKIKEAQVLSDEWEYKYRNSFKTYIYSRDIGDHAGLSQWLTEKYRMLELILGKEVCKKTHLSDMHTFNHAIPVVFRPCTFPMDAVTIPRKDEYRNHFSYGEDYYGLTPVVVFWTTYVAVTAASSGTGFVYFSGMIANLAEKAISLVTPGLSDFVFKTACGGE